MTESANNENTGAVIVHISFAVLFRFDGWFFEFDRRKPFGPWPLKKDGEPRARAGGKFYDMFSRFQSLTIEEQEKFRV